MNVGLCVIATGKYLQFVPPLWHSASGLFLPNHRVRLFLFSDQPLELRDCANCLTLHRPWPGPTLYRYHSMLAFRNQLESLDYLYYCDADMRFVGPVGDEVLGNLVATHHPGFYGSDPDAFTYDRNPASQAFVPPGSGRHYYAGGFQGGRADRYLKVMTDLRSRIDDDDRRGVVALWHDESHWNRYLLDSPPDVALSPAYCYPEGRALPLEPKLLALNKNHTDMRS
jgi:histo-blood group ABO system transferase